MLSCRQTRRAALVATTLVSLATPCGAQIAKGVAVSDTSHNAMRGPYLRKDVEKPAALKPGIGHPPRYPDTMRDAKRDGVVRVRFVVDRRGVPQLSTFQVTESDDSSFSVSVKRAVSDWRFRPARRKGTRVSQVVELGFYFGLADLPSRDVKDIDVVITAFPGVALPH
jgi:TonB family protein